MKFDHYLPMKHKSAHIFTFSEHPKQFSKEQQDFKYMEQARIKLRKAADELLTLIRTRFAEIDIDATSQAAGAMYDAEMARIDKLFDDAIHSKNSRHAKKKLQPSKTKGTKTGE